MAEEGQETPPAVGKSKNKNKLLMIVGVLIVLVFIGGGAFLFMNGGNPSSGSESPSPSASPVQETTIEATFTCADDKTIQATFNNGENSSVDLVMSDGTTMNLPQAVSGSGARYANSDESIVFWNQGNTAYLEENGVQTYTDCVTEPQS